MGWKNHLKDRTMTAGEAVKKINSGNRVVTGHAAGSPECLIKAMIERASELENVEIMHMVALNDSPYCKPEYANNFHFNGLYLSGGTRDAVAQGRADFTPIFFMKIPSLFTSGALPVDVALITVSNPDTNGQVSLGVSIDYTKTAALNAKTTIAIVNSNMPYVGGGALINVSDIDYFVFDDTPILELPAPHIGSVEQTIGQHIASLIKDGDCLQLGIGAIPDAVLSSLHEKKDLGIHSEMISDGIMSLVDAGVINGSKKTLHPGKIIINFAMGSKRFYEWLDQNPMVEGYPVDYVNDPRIIGQNDNLISINSALSVDLQGQVAADSVGTKQFSGVGGQVDFVRGAHFSKGGRSIIAMPSTAAKGKVSKICGCFASGQPVTTSRHDVDTIVTEYGIASLIGKTNLERARALIAIAHPDFREQLQKDARDIYGWHL